MVRHDLTCEHCDDNFAVDAPVHPTTLPDYCSHGCYLLG
jgi:hypothetical protein